MHAIRFDNYGHRDVLYVADIGIPEPAAGEVVVRVKAAGINPGEASIREGYLRDRFPATFPSGEGTDLAGIVFALGDGVDEWSLGDEVLGWSWTRSSHAEYTAVPADQLVSKPSHVSWEAAATLGVAGATAAAAVAAVNPGPADTIAVSGAAGGVGVFVVQLLRLAGSRVLGIASDVNRDWLQAHDVEQVAYGDGLAERIKAAAPDGIDAFIDLYGPEYIDLAVELGVSPDRIETIISFERAGAVGAKTAGSGDGTTRENLSHLAALIDGGKLEVPIAASYPLDRVQDAFAELEQRHTRGKIVLIP